MKKISFLVFAVLVMFTLANAGAMHAIPKDSVLISWEKIDTARPANIYSTDSVLGADSTVLFSKVSFTPGCTYAVVTYDSIGAADTCKVTCRLYETSYNGYKTIANIVCDTIEPVAATSSFTRATSLWPLNTYVLSKFDVKVVGWISLKVAKIRSASLWRGRLITGSYPVETPR
jgi:hypothetical protein